MLKFWALINALYKGRCLENAETWKNVQQATIALTAVVGLIPYYFPDLHITEGQVGDIVKGFSTIGFIVVSYLTPATTTKVGIGKTHLKK